MYLANTYKKICEERKYNFYGSKKIELPMPELYVLYLGKSKIKKKEFSLNEEYFNNKGSIDLKVKIITVRNKKDILSEYIEFANRCDEFRKKKIRPTEKNIINFINKCIKDDILKEFLQNNKEEIMSIETMLFDQDYVTEMYEHELFEEGKKEGMKEGKKEGMKEGIEQGKVELIKKLLKDGILKKEEAKRQLELIK